MSKFKVGDKVRIVDGSDGGHDIGVVGVIVKDDGSEFMNYNVHASGMTFWHGAENLELVTDTATTPSTTSLDGQIEITITIKAPAALLAALAS